VKLERLVLLDLLALTAGTIMPMVLMMLMRTEMEMDYLML